MTGCERRFELSGRRFCLVEAIGVIVCLFATVPQRRAYAFCRCLHCGLIGARTWLMEEQIMNFAISSSGICVAIGCDCRPFRADATGNSPMVRGHPLGYIFGTWGDCMGAGKLTLLPIDDVELDQTNPRIRRFLEFHQGEPTYEQIALALDVAGADSADVKGAKIGRAHV